MRFLYGMLTRSDDVLAEVKLYKLMRKDLCVWDRELDARSQVGLLCFLFLFNV